MLIVHLNIQIITSKKIAKMKAVHANFVVPK